LKGDMNSLLALVLLLSGATSTADAGTSLKEPSAPSPTLELLGATGALSEEQVAFLQQHQGGFRRCTGALAADTVSTTFTVPLTVLPDGRATLGRASGLAEPFWNCLSAVMRSTRLPATGKEGQNGVVSFRLRVPEPETISRAEMDAAKAAASAHTAESECLRAAARRLEQLAAQGNKVQAKERTAWRQKVAEARLAPECRLTSVGGPLGPPAGSDQPQERCPGCTLDGRP
jgi:hypothetical protein